MKMASKRAELDIEKLLNGGYKSQAKKKSSKSTKLNIKRKKTGLKRKKYVGAKKSKNKSSK